MRGFTLVEFVVTLVLIAIVAIAVFPRVPAKESLTLRGRAEQLASDIRYVQTLSMTRGERFCIAIAGTGYRLQGTTVNACDATKPQTQPAGLPQPVSLCGAGCTVTSVTIQFDGLGRPRSSAGVELATNTDIVIADVGGTRTVRVSPGTGRVSLP